MIQAEELIHDLDSLVIGRVFCTILVVAFKNEYKTIYHHDPDGVSKLTVMMHNGGLPIGFVKAVEINGGWKFLSQPLPEFKGNEHREVKKFLKNMALC